MAVERATVIAIHAARHIIHGDVGGQFHILVAEVFAAVDFFSKRVPFQFLVNDIGIGLCAQLITVPVRCVENDRDVDIATRHGDGKRLVDIITGIGNIVAVGIFDADAMHRRFRCLGQRDGLAEACPCHSRFVDFGYVCAIAQNADVDGVRPQYGIAIHRFVAGIVVFVLVEHVVTAILGAMGAHKGIVLGVGARHGAIEGAVVDSSVAVVTHQSAYAGIVVRHVARHAAVFHRAIVLTGDAAHLGSEHRP